MSTEGGGKIVTDGLILYYDGANPNSTFSGSTTFNDLSGSNYVGTLYNGASYVTDKGGGVSFDGVDDTIDLGNILNGVIAGTSPTYTVQAWIKFDTLAHDAAYTWFSKYGSGNNRQLLIIVRSLTYAPYSYGGFRIEHLPYRVPGIVSGLPQTRFVRSDGDVIEANKLHNLTVCFDGSINTNDGLDRPTFYIDGKLQSNVMAASYGPLTNVFQSTSTKVALNGFIGIGTTVELFPYAGTNYQTLFYDRVLTQEEVLQNYNTMKSRFNL
jgi:hypothetical protein